MDCALPLDTYCSSYTPAEKVVFPAQPSPDDVETTASDIQPHDQQYDGSSDNFDDSKQVQEYDTDSHDVSEHLSDDEDVLPFSVAHRQVVVEWSELCSHCCEQFVWSV